MLVSKKSENGQTFETVDGSISAHFESEVAVTKNGYRILTTLCRKPQPLGWGKGMPGALSVSSKRRPFSLFPLLPDDKLE